MMPNQRRPGLPIRFQEGHAYMTILGSQWVLDTGAPASFGETSRHPLDDSRPLLPGVNIANGGWSDASSVSSYLGVQVAGVIGCDFLNQHDLLIDLPNGVFQFLDSGIPRGHAHILGFPPALRGVPTMEATIGGQSGRYIFDTGAQLSYYVGTPPAGHTPGPACSDFWPGTGRFLAPTFIADVAFAGYTMPLRFGQPVEDLKSMLLQANLKGIIGIDLIRQKACGYYPRRKLLIIQ
jgi:hypothetical protein